MVKVGGGTGQDPATEVTHLRLNQPPVFSSVASSICTLWIDIIVLSTEFQSHSQDTDHMDMRPQDLVTSM